MSTILLCELGLGAAREEDKENKLENRDHWVPHEAHESQPSHVSHTVSQARQTQSHQGPLTPSINFKSMLLCNNSQG